MNIFRKHSKEVPTKITNETIEEHRRAVLARGRKFKYPLQYSKHKLVFNTIIIGFVAIIIGFGVIGYRLYFANVADDFDYSITRIFPLPVAYVGKWSVRYSDYLMHYRSSINYLEKTNQINLKSADGQNQAKFIEKEAMNNAIDDTIIEHLASQNKISVSDSEINNLFKEQMKQNNNISESNYYALILNYYNWTPSEYKNILKDSLLKRKLANAVDVNAKKVSDGIKANLGTISSFNNYVESYNANNKTKLTYASSGWTLIVKNDPLISYADNMSVNQVSGPYTPVSSDGYFFVKLLGKTDDMVNYEYIEVPLTELNNKIDKIKKDNKTTKYIKI